jgi:hypothetical protein
MLIAHCGNTVFPYQALEGLAQETLMGCAGLHNINSKAVNIHSVYAYMSTVIRHTLRRQLYSTKPLDDHYGLLL